MKNAMQLKAVIKNIAKEKRISAQLVLQNYMLERFLERIQVFKIHQEIDCPSSPIVFHYQCITHPCTYV
jgi:hypothetical protein